MNSITVVGDITKAKSLLATNNKVDPEKKRLFLDALNKGVYEISKNCTPEEYKARENERLKKMHAFFGTDVSKVYLYQGEKSNSSDTKGWYKIANQVYNPGVHSVKNLDNYSYLLYTGPEYSTSLRKPALNAPKLLEHAQKAYENAFIDKKLLESLNQKYG